MDLRQLHALLAVAEHQSFSAAARALHTVQSNVSTHVAHLEQSLGATLIDRTRGELTAEGEVVAIRARRILGELRAIEDDLVAMRDDVAGYVRLGVIGTTAHWLVPVLLEHLAEAHPRVELVTVEATTTSLLPQLTSEYLDAAVVNLPVDDPDIDSEVLFEEDRIVIAPSGHPLADHDRVDLTVLADHELLLPPPGTAFRDEIDADAMRAKVKLQTQAEVDGLRLLSSLAFQGFGAALVPASAAPNYLSGDWRRVVVEGVSPRVVGLAIPRRSAPSAPTRVVLETLRALIASLGPDTAHLVPAVQTTTNAAPE